MPRCVLHLIAHYKEYHVAVYAAVCYACRGAVSVMLSRARSTAPRITRSLGVLHYVFVACP